MRRFLSTLGTKGPFIARLDNCSQESSMKVASMGTSHTLESHDLEAKANPTARPKRPGPKRHWWPWVVVVGLLAFGAWHFRAAIASRQAQSGAPTARGGFGVRPVPVVVATAQRGDVPVYLAGLGSVAAFNTVTVRSRVDGELVNVAFREGQYVDQGDLLAEIDPRPFQVQLEQAEGQLARDLAQLNDAKINYDRDVALFNEQIVSKQQVDSQKALVSQFEGAIKADQAQIDNAKLQLAYSRITAPIGGRIGLRLIDPGNIIHANDQNGLLVITQLQPIAVLFSLPQDDLPAVYNKIRAGAKLSVEAYDRDNTTKVGTGTLLTIDNQIDPSTGTYKLKAVFNNEKGLLFPNQFVNVRIRVDTRRGLTIIPAAAIQRSSQGSYVYVVDGNTARVRPITMALTAGGNVGVSEGLGPDEAVVIDGQDKLQDGSKVDPQLAKTGARRAGRGAE